MSCSEDCRCSNKVIALVFVPGIMGTRLKNVETGDSVWDPAAGLRFSGSSSAVTQNRLDREAELKKAHPADDDEILDSVTKWFSRQWIKATKLIDENIAEPVRLTRTKLALIPRITDWVFASPAERKALLVGKKSSRNKKKSVTERDDELLAVDEGTDRYFRIYTSVPRSQMALKRKRGWGEVHWDSYGPMLKYLSDLQSKFQETYSKLQFPVFAVGYNWMLSNKTGGERLKTKLKEFKKQILDEDKAGDNLGLTDADIKFIVISHSMGGFVSRSACQLSGITDSIEGVIHGAMPTHGSPSTYHQFRTGARSARIVIGKNAADITAILGFCQGGLELLPNNLYVNAAGKQAPWLFVNTSTREGKGTKQPLTTHDDIYDFYQSFDKWYSMVQPELLAPELTLTGAEKESAINKHKIEFQKLIKNCRAFHQKLADHFHPSTKLIFSTNPDTKAFDHCQWQLIDKLTEGLTQSPVTNWVEYSNQNHKRLFGKGDVGLISPKELENHNNRLTSWRTQVKHSQQYCPPPTITTATFRLSDETANGDGTVHEGVGNFPKESSDDGVVAGEEHQMFYNCSVVEGEVEKTLTIWVKEIHRKMSG